MGLIFKITAPIVWTIASTFTFNVDIALEKVPVEILEKGVKYFQTIKTPEQRHRFGVFIVNSESISHLFLVFYCLL